MAIKRRGSLLLLALVMAVTSLVELGVCIPEAHAVIGRPLTPISYAGVARRTTRRTVRRAAYVYPGPLGW